MFSSSSMIPSIRREKKGNLFVVVWAMQTACQMFKKNYLISSFFFQDRAIMVGRHFSESDEIVSQVTRNSIDLLKENFRDKLSREDWLCVIQLKKLLSIA